MKNDYDFDKLVKTFDKCPVTYFFCSPQGLRPVVIGPFFEVGRVGLVGRTYQNPEKW